VAAIILDGKAFAQKIRTRLAEKIERLKKEHGITPGLSVVLVGNHPASEIYVKNKRTQCVEVGMKSVEVTLPEHVEERELIIQIQNLNLHNEVHGILVQLPLPKHINEELVINTINPMKDVDGFHIYNAGKLMTGQDALVPCTPLGCSLILKDHLGDLSGKHAVVIGRSNIVGKPMAQLLLKENCTVTMAHSRTKDLPSIVRSADIVVAAVGRPEMVRGDWIKKGAVVVDVGINRLSLADGKTKLVGDVAFDEVKEIASAITPVPGGVGPMTIACLLENTYKATCMQYNIGYML
jgi:methylenetetrahydrofolate dehydrogenase (NADP+)/methenyltetrahydrofolate cyclohydrolase